MSSLGNGVKSVVTTIQLLNGLMLLLRSGPPEFYYKMKENPALTFMIVFLVIPSYVQSFANTGAFEIFLDDKLIFSKLETGRMPNVGEIMAAMEKAGLQREYPVYRPMSGGALLVLSLSCPSPPALLPLSIHCQWMRAVVSLVSCLIARIDRHILIIVLEECTYGIEGHHLDGERFFRSS
eukprot:scaffold627_cov144-Skeletonema_menzelii.AAC.31